jgi:hypothetical protein
MANYSNIFVNEGLSYAVYKDLIETLLAEHKTTGSDNSEAMLHYTKMNMQRMHRVEKTALLGEELTAALSKLKNKYRLLVISEGWCGDAAQITPVFHKITTLYGDQFELRFVLRDQHLELIDAHLTNGGRAIPVLLVLDEKGELLAKWGPRPAVIQELLNKWKTEISDMFVLAEKLHLWYAKDKTHAIQSELTALVSSLE